MSTVSYRQLEKRFHRIHLLRSIEQVLRWDGEVMLPTGSAPIRAEQLALLETESNSILRSRKTGHLLDRAESHASALNDWQSANLREMRRLWQQANAIPHRIVNAFHRATTRADMQWRLALAEGNFAPLAPHLERVIEVVRDKALALGTAVGCSPYDALLNEHDPGRREAELERVFAKVALGVPPLIAPLIDFQSRQPVMAIAEPTPVARQKDLGKRVMKALGFPFNKGRLDESLHPFTEGTAADIRVTSRFDRYNFMTGLMGVLHETGHAMYDYGLPGDWATQPVGRDRGMAMHESQALFLEMMIGRDRPFMKFCAPLIGSAFRVEGKKWSAENLYRLATRVQRSLIRMDADEVTYPVHLLVRWELERALFDGTLAVRHLPEAWNENMRRYLGLVPSNDRDGCLQDSHWPLGYFGYFSTYMMGLVIAAQLYRVMRLDLPDFESAVAAGRFGPLFEWLEHKIYGQGARLGSEELLRQATGEAANPEHYLDYLKNKYPGAH